MTMNKDTLYVKRKRPTDMLLLAAIYVSATLAVALLLGIILYVFVKGIHTVNWAFLTTVTSARKQTTGIAGNLLNTLYIIVITLLIATPIGVGSAIYLNEYAKPGKLVSLIEFTTETLSGIPSIVYGLFGYLMFGVAFHWGYSMLSGALTLAIMVLPSIMRTTEEALKAVPDSYREGSFGLGAGRLRTVFVVILPSAIPGILAGVILAIGRITGETAALIYTAGTVAKVPKNVLSSGRTLAVHMYNLSSEGLYMNQMYATGVILMLIISAFPQLWNRTGCKILTAGWVLALGSFFVLMLGGCFGLSKIDPDYWGGLPLTIILTLFGMTASTPLGILLALGRRSKMSAIRMLCIGYIELVRGVPLITVLFVASFIFPLILPPGFRIDAFWRIVIGIVLFQAAYMAETIRGGLQTIPKGQYEAAASLGLSKYQIYTSVILPQALVTVIPAFVNNLLSTFMDTSLVTIVSMYDLTGSLRLALGDPNWRNFFLEGYLFIAIIYFVFSLIMSRYSIWLEKRIQRSKEQAALSAKKEH